MELDRNHSGKQVDLIPVQRGICLKGLDVRSGLSDYLYELDDKRWWWLLVISAGAQTKGIHEWNWNEVRKLSRSSILLFDEVENE